MVKIEIVTEKAEKDPQPIVVQEEVILAQVAWIIHKWLDVCHLEDPGPAQVELLARQLFQIARGK